MTRFRRASIALGAVVAPATAATWVLAQTPATPTAPPLTAPPDTTASHGGLLLVVAAVAVLLAVLITAVRLYDLKRRQEQSAMTLQAKLSDALLLEPSLSDFPIVAIVYAPLRKRSPVIVDIAGPVPSLELRDLVLRIVKRETAGIGREVRIEDRMVVHPLVARHAA